jgi:hypothetical protein
MQSHGSHSERVAPFRKRAQNIDKVQEWWEERQRNKESAANPHASI